MPITSLKLSDPALVHNAGSIINGLKHGPGDWEGINNNEYGLIPFLAHHGLCEEAVVGGGIQFLPPIPKTTPKRTSPSTPMGRSGSGGEGARPRTDGEGISSNPAWREGRVRDGLGEEAKGWFDGISASLLHPLTISRDEPHFCQGRSKM